MCSGRDSVKCVVRNGTERVVMCDGGGQLIAKGGKWKGRCNFLYRAGIGNTTCRQVLDRSPSRSHG